MGTVELPKWKFKGQHKTPKSILSASDSEEIYFKIDTIKATDCAIKFTISLLVFSHASVNIIGKHFKHQGKV